MRSVEYRLNETELEIQRIVRILDHLVNRTLDNIVEHLERLQHGQHKLELTVETQQESLDLLMKLMREAKELAQSLTLSDEEWRKRIRDLALLELEGKVKTDGTEARPKQVD